MMKKKISDKQAQVRCTQCKYKAKMFAVNGINYFYACSLKSAYIGDVVKCPIGREVKDED